MGTKNVEDPNPLSVPKISETKALKIKVKSCKFKVSSSPSLNTQIHSFNTKNVMLLERLHGLKNQTTACWALC